MNRHIGKWARRQNVTCYRIYDRDVPQFPFLVERFEDALCVSEFAKSLNVTQEEHEAWLSQCMEIIARVTAVPQGKIFLRKRERQRGTSQYTRVELAETELIAHETDLRFKLNLSSYLDTGLFLDHRITRALVRKESHGKNFLNLFAYTGSFTIYAAAGGAKTTVTVDLSKTYTAWTHENMRLNGFQSTMLLERDFRPGALTGKRPAHLIVQSDVLDFIKTAPADLFDLVVVDPPSFSNSKRMDTTFDVQRDHIQLLNSVLRITAPGGTVYFSNNLKSFKLRDDEIRGAEIRNITKQTIPNDFRNERVHSCFKLTKNATRL